MRVIGLVLSFSVMVIGSAQPLAQSIASFPANWSKWALVKESFVPGSDIILPPETPLFLQETIRYVNKAFDGQSSHLRIFVNPDKRDEYRHGGPYSDGATAVGIFDATGVVFVTEHLGGQAVYGIYSMTGEDLAGTSEVLDIQHCVQCHDDYSDVCRNGVCTVDIDETFDPS